MSMSEHHIRGCRLSVPMLAIIASTIAACSGSGSNATSDSDAGSLCPKPCGDACVYLDTDPDNCGACGVHCGGQCTFGRCAAVLASGLGTSTQALAVDDADLYWVAAENQYPALKKVPVTGGDAVIVAGVDDGRAITIDHANVYAAGRTIQKIDKQTGVVTALSGAEAQSAVIVEADATNVYWANYDTNVDSGTLKRVPIGGGEITPLATIDRLRGMALTPARLIWASQEAVSSLPLDGSSTVPAKLAPYSGSDLANAMSLLAADSKGAYWLEEGMFGGELMQVPIDGSSAAKQVDLVRNVGDLYVMTEGRHIATDGKSVYWNSGDNSIYKWTIGVGLPARIADANNARGIAVDATSVYWIQQLSTESDTYQIVKLTPK